MKKLIINTILILTISGVLPVTFLGLLINLLGL